MDRRSFIQTLAIGALAGTTPSLWAGSAPEHEEEVKDYLFRMRHPDNHYQQDIRTSDRERRDLMRVKQHLDRVQKVVGFGNFNVISFDEMLKYARHHAKIGRFDSKETELLERIFYQDASRYGFFGEKPLADITASIDRKGIAKVPGSGHYLFKGHPLELYRKIRREIGDSLYLTSGIRGVVKQIHLFLAKASRNQGNLSLASRSLAPPGYSFHGAGDFDVGRVGLGADNFSEAFAATEEFRRLRELGYIDIRYPLDNHLGVRFEPWHIKIT